MAKSTNRGWLFVRKQFLFLWGEVGGGGGGEKICNFLNSRPLFLLFFLLFSDNFREAITL